MSIGAQLIHRCTIQRATRAPDALRQDIKSYQPHSTAVPCRLIAKTQRIYSTQQAQLLSLTVHKLFLAPGVDIQAGDRITDLLYEDSQLISAEIFAVRTILPRRGRTVRHITLELERIT